MTLVVCPVCDRVLERHEATKDEVESLVDDHEANLHDGDDTVQVFDGAEVPPDGVNALYDRLDDESREHRERFVRRVMRDDRFRTSDDAENEGEAHA